MLEFINEGWIGLFQTLAVIGVVGAFIGGAVFIGFASVRGPIGGEGVAAGVVAAMSLMLLIVSMIVLWLAPESARASY